jgi:hypothetical protein
MAVTIKNTVFWHVAPCSFCVNRRFGGMYRLHFQGRKIRERGTSVNRWLLWKHHIPAHKSEDREEAENFQCSCDYISMRNSVL